jgi:hypothetical protein
MSFLPADPKIANGLLSQTCTERGWDIRFFIVSGVIGSLLASFGYLTKTDTPPAVPADVPTVAAAPPSGVPPAAALPSIEATAPAPILPDHPAESAISPRSDSIPLPRPRPTRRHP